MGTFCFLWATHPVTNPNSRGIKHVSTKFNDRCFKVSSAPAGQDKNCWPSQRPPPLLCLPGGCHSLDRAPWAWLACAWPPRASCNTAGMLWPCSYWYLWSLLLPESWLFHIPEMNSNCGHLCGCGLWDTETITLCQSQNRIFSQTASSGAPPSTAQAHTPRFWIRSHSAAAESRR